MARFVVLALALATVACPAKREEAPTPPRPPSSSPAAAATPAVDAAPPPLGGDWIEKLDLPESGLAYVTPPIGAREPRPIVVGIHGAWDDPGLMCSAYRLIVDVYAFVVCPAGRPVDPARKDGRLYVWSSGDHIAKRVTEAVAATKAKYPGRIAEDAPMIYVAFSQGSNLAGTLLAREPEKFARVIFTEGGYHTFEDAGIARAFAKGAAKDERRVLFTCSQPGCAGSFAASRAMLERAGIASRTEYSGPHGHSMPPPVREGIHASLPWIVEDLRGWEGYASAPKLSGH